MLPLSVKDALHGWHARFVGKSQNRVWRMGPLFVLMQFERV